MLVDPNTRTCYEFNVSGPKLHTIASNPAIPLVMSTGSRHGEFHCVLGFPCPQNPKDILVVDMTRRQYGNVGRGFDGENYSLGRMEDFIASMGKICEGLESAGNIITFETTGTENEARLRACATRVLERWQNRDIEGWCEYCGKGGNGLMRCSGCKKTNVRYCCREHQVAGW